MIGQVLGHYRIVEKIGAGGMGEVYRAHDEQLDRDVAVKVLPPGALSDEATRKHFRLEALTLAKLNHPNIETVHEFSSHAGVDFLAMELIPGCSLAQKLKDGGPVSELELLRLAVQFAEGLAVAHEHGVIHRDLKPSNLMITPDGRLKILDFGLARLLLADQDADLTQSISTTTGSISGTVPYMSPEQLRGLPVDARSDIYAAGSVLYEMATGHRPFPQSQSAELIGAILHEQPDPPSSRNRRITPGLESVVMKALEKDPSRRYQSARELRVALEGVAVGAPQPRRSRVALFATAAAAIMVVLLIGLTVGLNIGGVADRLLRRGASPSASAASAPIKPRRSVAVLGFKNVSQRSEEAWFSTALSEMLTTELAAGEQLRAVPGENVARMKINLSLPETDSYGKETLAKIRNNINADDVVLGSFVPLGGGQIRVDLRLQDTQAGETLAVASVKGDETQIDELAARAGATLREKLGVGQVSPTQARAVKATLPQNSDAARFYSEGLEKLHQFDYLRARDLFQRAVAAEPQYALAHSALAVAWKGLGYDLKAREEARNAFDLSADFSREDRLWIEGQYHEFNNEKAKAVETYKTLFDFFPDNLDYGLRLASVQSAAGKAADARATVELLRKLPAPASDDARIDLTDAVASAALGDYKHQQASAAAAVQKADAQGARLLAAQARISQCSSLRYIGKPEEAVPVCQAAKKIFESAGDRGNAARALNNIAVVLMEKGDLAGAKKNYDESLRTQREIGDKRSEAMVLNNLAGVLRGQMNLTASRKMLEEAGADFREIGDKGGMVRSLENIGLILVDEGQLEQARKNYQEALSICHEINNKSLTAYGLYLLGDVEFAQDHLDAAGKSYQQSLEIRQEIGEERTIAESQLALASLATHQGQFAQAETAARGNVETFHKLNAADNEALAYAILARALAAQDKMADARAARDKAAALGQKSQDTSVRLRVAIDSAQVQAKSGAPADIADAKSVLQAALADARKENLTALQLESRLALAQITLKSNDVAAGRTQLGLLQKDASSKGFSLIAREAAASTH